MLRIGETRPIIFEQRLLAGMIMNISYYEGLYLFLKADVFLPLFSSMKTDNFLAFKIIYDWYTRQYNLNTKLLPYTVKPERCFWCGCFIKIKLKYHWTLPISFTWKHHIFDEQSWERGRQKKVLGLGIRFGMQDWRRFNSLCKNIHGRILNYYWKKI